MKTPRRPQPYKPRPAGTLKEALAELVTAAGGNVRAAELLRTSASQVQRYTDPAEPDYCMRVDQVRALEAATGRAIVTEFLAREAGGVLLPIETAGLGALGAEIAATAQEIAEMFGAFAEIQSDASEAGAEVTANEAGRAVAEIDDVFEKIAAVRAWFVSIRDGGNAEGGEHG